MKFRPSNLTQERLKEILTYDPLTGIFRWNLSRRMSKAGDVAGHKGAWHWKITVDNELFFAHRLAFLYMTGQMPPCEVDHINGNGFDNRFVNLRLTVGFHNQQNRRSAQCNSTTGLLGVTRHRKRWRAQLTSNGKRLYLGSFDTPEEAYVAYVQAKRELHPGGML